MKDFILIYLVLVFVSCSTKDSNQQSFETVKIGKTDWTTENLRITSFRNGDEIEIATSFEQWEKYSLSGIPAGCYYDFDESNKNFGIFYNYFVVTDQRNIAPEGYRVATKQDFLDLENNFGNNEDESGIKMISNKSIRAIFNTFPGYINFGNISTHSKFDNGFYENKKVAKYWIDKAHFDGGSSAYFDNENYFSISGGDYYDGFLIRCVKDDFYDISLDNEDLYQILKKSILRSNTFCEEDFKIEEQRLGNNYQLNIDGQYDFLSLYEINLNDFIKRKINNDGFDDYEIIISHTGGGCGGNLVISERWVLFGDDPTVFHQIPEIKSWLNPRLHY